MEEVIEKIKSLNDFELKEVMQAIKERYTVAYPDWDVVYIALHKDPKLRKAELGSILRAIDNGA